MLAFKSNLNLRQEEVNDMPGLPGVPQVIIQPPPTPNSEMVPLNSALSLIENRYKWFSEQQSNKTTLLLNEIKVSDPAVKAEDLQVNDLQEYLLLKEYRHLLEDAKAKLTLSILGRKKKHF